MAPDVRPAPPGAVPAPAPPEEPGDDHQRAAVAAVVAWARIHGQEAGPAGEGRAGRRAAAVIDALVAARAGVGPEGEASPRPVGAIPPPARPDGPPGRPGHRPTPRSSL